MKFKKLKKKDYGKIALLGLLLAGIKGAVQISLPSIILVLSDILITVGFISGIIWVVMTIKTKKIKDETKN